MGPAWLQVGRSNALRATGSASLSAIRPARRMLARRYWPGPLSNGMPESYTADGMLIEVKLTPIFREHAA